MLDQLAHHPDPYPFYAELRERGVHQLDDGRWIVARAVDIETVLASPGVAVGFEAAVDDPAAAVQARMARFSDGDDHDRRRAVAVAQLTGIEPARLRDNARLLARARIGGSAHRDIDVMTELARPVPVAVLAQQLGAADPDAAVGAARELCLALAPPAGGERGDATAPATRLAELLETGPAGSALTDEAINVMALLFQAMDATAGLVGNAVVARRRCSTRYGLGTAADLVAETNRFDPSVQLTNRIAARSLQIGGVTVPGGERIVLLLAAANRDPVRFDRPDEFDTNRSPAPLTFGTGSRPCPGGDHALAVATGVLEAIGESGATLVESAIDYEPRPNLRIPSRLTLRGAG